MADIARPPKTVLYTPGSLLAPVLVLSLLLFNAVFCAGEPKSIVAELTDEYFEEGLLDYNHAIVLFYSQQCVHCSNFMPTFKMAADELIRNEPPVHSAMVDCVEAGKHTCLEEEIRHLPTLKIYRRATLIDEYDGPRKLENMVAYMKKLVGITSMEVAIDNLENFANSQKEVVVVAVLRGNGNLRENYFSLPAELSKDIRFGHVTMDAEKNWNLTHGVTLYHPGHMRSIFEPWEYTYDNINEGYDLLEFILKNRYGIAGLRGLRNVDDFGPPLVIIYLKVDINLKAKMFSYWRNRILKVAKKYQQFFNFALSPIDDFLNEFIKFGITPPSDKFDSLLVFAMMADNNKYLMEEEFSMEAFDNFLTKILNGTAEPHLKSQAIPEVVTEKGVVQTVVAKNFKEAVWGNEKDVLLEFFAPWCTFCKELEIVLDDLAKTLVDVNEDVAIFKMDATENEIPINFYTPRFPTLYFIPKRDKYNPILYEGGANLKELATFIAEHSTDKAVLEKDEL